MKYKRSVREAHRKLDAGRTYLAVNLVSAIPHLTPWFFINMVVVGRRSSYDNKERKLSDESACDLTLSLTLLDNMRFRTSRSSCEYIEGIDGMIPA